LFFHAAAEQRQFRTPKNRYFRPPILIGGLLSEKLLFQASLKREFSTIRIIALSVRCGKTNFPLSVKLLFQAGAEERILRSPKNRFFRLPGKSDFGTIRKIALSGCCGRAKIPLPVKLFFQSAAEERLFRLSEKSLFQSDAEKRLFRFPKKNALTSSWKSDISAPGKKLFQATAEGRLFRSPKKRYFLPPRKHNIPL
jgi:hypothetical protein